MKLNYVIKYVSNMGMAINFYKDQLGLTLKFQSPHWSEFETGETTLALHLASAKNTPGTLQLGFGVTDLDEFYVEKKNNIEFTSAPTELFGNKIAKFKDAEGVECNVSEK